MWDMAGPVVVAALAAYFLGNLNGAVTVSTLLDKDDVRSHGSGNAGMTNYMRSYGLQKTGLVVLIDLGKALLACFMGATFDEVVEDYMTTYVNYYHLEKGSEQYLAVQESNIIATLKTITGVTDVAVLKEADLSSAATAYFSLIGLTAEEIGALKANLAKDYALPEEAPEETPEEVPEETPEETPEEVPEETPGESAAYTVVAGDCLWNIAYRFYGAGGRWPEIYEANKDIIRDPAMIYVGQVLVIPAA